MPHDVLAVANYFLNRADADRTTLDHMKLQKLVYIAHGWHLAVTGTPLIFERVEAWPFGPVIPDLYHEFKKCGSHPIAEPAMTIDFDTWQPTPYSLDRSGLDDGTRDVLDRVWNVYGKYSGLQLSTLTHQPNTPWDQIAKQASTDKPRGVVIPPEVIQDHYLSLAGRRPQHVA